MAVRKLTSQQGHLYVHSDYHTSPIHIVPYPGSRVHSFLHCEVKKLVNPLRRQTGQIAREYETIAILSFFGEYHDLDALAVICGVAHQYIRILICMGGAMADASFLFLTHFFTSLKSFVHTPNPIPNLNLINALWSSSAVSYAKHEVVPSSLNIKAWHCPLV